MAKEVTSFRSPLVLSNTDYTACFPVSVVFPGNPKLPRKLWGSTKVGRICSGHREMKPSASGSGFTWRNSKENLEVEEQKLNPLWDDEYGTQTVKDYIEAAKDMIQHDSKPLRWFCPIESGPPLKNSPVLLYLPGMDGVGLGMILHHKPLGKVFQLRCMHIPVNDRTPYEGLMRFVENTVRAEHASHPNRPIYLVGDSFGGCLALSVAAANPTIDLVLILVNPATSFNRSQLQPLIPFLEVFPGELFSILLHLLTTTLGDPIKMANVINSRNPSIPPVKQLEKLILELRVLLPRVKSLGGLLPKETLIWKLKLLKTAAAHSNSRLHAVRAQVLVLASGKDSILPSKNEAQRLLDSLSNCRVRFFKNNGHCLLMEEGIHLLNVLKALSMFRRSKQHDYISDFLPPSKSEFENTFNRQLGIIRVGTSPVMLSTLPDGKIVRGLTGIPQQGPVLLVGYHMFLGFEIGAITEEFLREKNVMVMGMAHPETFTKSVEQPLQEVSFFDTLKVFGGVPATPRNLFKLLSAKSHVLLYPGGVREALHHKGEDYKLFWPENTEFVRMATRFRATIVPFGVVGQDDMVELFLDHDDKMIMPFVKDMIKSKNQSAAKVTPGTEKGQTAKQDFFLPAFYPKVPGRFYFLFGKPIKTEGKEELLKDNNLANEFYKQIKSIVERNIAYLLKKREEDPYRHLHARLLYRAISAPSHHIPAFDP